MISKDNKPSSGEHKKHTNLKRPSLGNFARNEFAFVGGTCADIKLLAGKLINSLSINYKCAYADTSHQNENTLPGHLKNGAVLDYSDEISFGQINFQETLNPFKQRTFFAEMDLVLVNGNHQQAKNQVVIICESKKESLKKRLAQLTNVQLFLLDEGQENVFDFFLENIQGAENIPVYRLKETEKIIDFFKDKMKAAMPPLNGLVLAGGKSERMGFEKGNINWHGKEQQYYMADLLKSYCSEVFISCRNDQQKDVDKNYNTLSDTFTGLGPFGAILSAFRENPDSAWLVIACDLPLINSDTLDYLINNRNCSSIATTYQSNFDNFPEPLITIWEPKSYPVLLSFLAQGYSCPRKVLINSDITLLNAPNPEDLTNVNTPEEFDQVKNKLQQKITV